MIWKKLTEWIEQRPPGLAAHPLEFDDNRNLLICEVTEPLDESQELKLTFPCGNSVETRPVWQRSEAEEQSLAAFCWEGLSPLEGPVNTRDDEPRASTRLQERQSKRLWVSFASFERNGTVTRNLSLGGCQLVGDFRDDLGAILSLYLELPDGLDLMKVNARVVWADGKNGGLQFVNLKTADEQRLLRNLGVTDLPPPSPLPSFFTSGEELLFEVKLLENRRLSLEVSLENWDLYFLLEDADMRGQQSGSYEKGRVLDWSPELADLKARLRLELSERHQLVHFHFLDGEGDIVCEAWGREIEFRSHRRGHTS